MALTKATTKKRSKAYPSMDLSSAIEAVSKLRKELGNGPYDRKSMSGALGHQAVTGSSASKIAALVHFGLLDRRGNSYQQSPLADRIIKPTSENEEKEAIREAMRTPSLFAELLDNFKGQGLPAMLHNILARNYGINEKVASKVAENFQESAQFAGILEHGVILEKEAQEKKKNEERVSPNSKPAESEVNPRNRSDIQGEINIRLDSGIVVQIPAKLGYRLAKGEFADPLEKLNDLLPKGVASESKNKTTKKQLVED